MIVVFLVRAPLMAVFGYRLDTCRGARAHRCARGRGVGTGLAVHVVVIILDRLCLQPHVYEHAALARKMPANLGEFRDNERFARRHCLFLGVSRHLQEVAGAELQRVLLHGVGLKVGHLAASDIAYTVVY